MRRGTIALLLGLVPGMARAQDGAPQDTIVVPLPEVVVTALRGEDRLENIPATAFVIPRAQLAASAMARLSSVLQWLPGLYAFQSGPTGEPTTVDPRGFTANGESSYLKVLVDGHDVRDLENGDVDWDWIAPGEIDRIEVVEGSGAWVYGDGAEGGIVNIVRDPPVPGLHPWVTLRGGSFEHQGAQAGLRWGADPWSLSADGGGRDVEGWRDRSREEIRNARVLASWRPGASTSLALDGSWLETDREDPGALTPEQIAADREQAENPEDYANSSRGIGGLTLVHGDPRRGQWTVAPSVRFDDLDQNRTLFFNPMIHVTSGTTLGNDLGWRSALELGGRSLRLAMGYGVEWGELRSRYYSGPPGQRRSGVLLAHAEARRLTQAVHGSAQLDWTPDVTLRVGLRADAIRLEFEERLPSTAESDRTLSAVSPFGAVSVRRGDATVYASVNGAFHAPTLNQLYDRRPFLIPPGPVFSISNPELDPQRSAGYEVGGRWSGAAGHAASLAFYDVYVRDEIDFDLATFSYANLGKSRHTGVLASGRAALGRGLAVTAAGTWAPTTIRGGANDGNQINAVPLGSALGRLEWSPASWIAADAGVRWVARQYLDKENDHPLGEFATTELGVSGSLGRARLSARVTNLFDREYSDTGFMGATGEERLVPAAGRAFSVTIRAE